MSNKAVFLKVARGALMGNDFNGWPTRQATGMTHTYRMAYADRLAILHNKVISGGLDAGTIRACPWNGGVQSGVCNGRYTQYVYSANNEHIGCDGTAGAAPCMRVADVKPGITPNEGRIRDLIFDSNVFRAGPDGPMGSTLTGFVFHGDRITVRNNICDATNGRANVLCFHVSLDSVGTPAPVGSRVYNNTCYRGPDGAGVACVGATAGSGHEARNNLVFNSGTGTSNMIFRSVGLTQSNNVIASSNPFVSSAPTTPADFMLRSDAPAIDVGVHISSNLVDFSGSPRPRDGNGDGISNPDVGALEFLGIDSPGAPSPPILLDGGP